MKYINTLMFSLIVLSIACEKSDIKTDTKSTQKKTTPIQSDINNLIMGKWELGPFKIFCGGYSDTTIYVNTKGDYVEFAGNDTAYYTYNTTNATGWSPFSLLDDSTFILGDTMHIVSFDGKNLTTYCRTILSGGNTQEWMTYIKN
jgi:hypothetical protein